MEMERDRDGERDGEREGETGEWKDKEGGRIRGWNRGSMGWVNG